MAIVCVALQRKLSLYYSSRRSELATVRPNASDFSAPAMAGCGQVTAI